MSTSEIKAELRILIDEENDLDILRAIQILLKKKGNDTSSMLKEKLTSRALKAEQDIQNGRLMSRKQLEQKSDAHFDE